VIINFQFDVSLAEENRNHFLDTSSTDWTLVDICRADFAEHNVSAGDNARFQFVLQADAALVDQNRVHQLRQLRLQVFWLLVGVLFEQQSYKMYRKI